MLLTDAIAQLQRFAEQLPSDARFELFDKDAERTLRADPDTEQWEFEILRGDKEVVIEF